MHRVATLKAVAQYANVRVDLVPSREQCSLQRHLALDAGAQLRDWVQCTVRVFRQKFTREDGIESHTCSLKVKMRVTNGIPLGCSLLLPVHTVNCVQTLKVSNTTCNASQTGCAWCLLCTMDSATNRRLCHAQHALRSKRGGACRFHSADHKLCYEPRTLPRTMNSASNHGIGRNAEVGLFMPFANHELCHPNPPR
jgi:hypothetical protein